MKQFLAVFLGTTGAMEDWNRLPEGVRNERAATGLRAWYDWADRHRDSIVDAGGPLGRTKSVSASGTVDLRNALMAYVIVRAESHEEAARIFEKHPHFMIFPGESVEIMEVLPVPPR